MQNSFKLGLITWLLLLTTSVGFSQCIEIESILVDACEGNTNAEGQNEMVRFKIGPNNQSIANLEVDWPSNNWGGLIQNTTTAQKVAQINAEIIAAGGCGTVLEPTNGILPASATVILVTSHLFDVALNPFGAMNDTIYILFQNSDVVAGHFANFGTGLRSLTIHFGNACSDTVTYDRSLLIDADGQSVAGNGATVDFTPNGTATYINNSCSAPVANTIFEITQYPESTCASSTIQLVSEVSGYQNIQWSSPDGTFGNANALITNFTVNPNATGSVSITLTMTNMCDAEVSQTITIPLQQQIVPIFDNLPNQICNTTDLPVLPTVSSNGIVGVWSPATIQLNYSGDYIFTPNAGQCAKVVSYTINPTLEILSSIMECRNNQMIIEVNIGELEDVEYIWRNSLGDVIATNDNVLNVTEYISELDDYNLPLIIQVEATFGECIWTESFIVQSTYCSIQKGVSPNGDGKNDFFDLRSMQVLQINIFNRYGTNVFKKALYRDEWHGQNNNGDLLPVGTYFYEIETVNGPITGWIELMY